MAPTLWGPHAELRCDQCGVTWSIHWQEPLRPRGEVTCWNCGAPVPTRDAQALPGTRVRLFSFLRVPTPAIPTPAIPAPTGPCSTSEVRIGQLVAIRVPNSPFGDAETATRGASSFPPGDIPPSRSRWAVKRVVALPGQVLTERDGRLLVDGRAISEWLDELTRNECPPPGWPVTFPVHDDRYRPPSDASWWTLEGTDSPERPTAPVGPARVAPSARAAAPAMRSGPYESNAEAGGFSLDAGDSSSPWLEYHHRAVHDRLRPDVIRDEVPGNTTEVRALRPVDRLLLSFRVRATTAITIEVKFRLEGKSHSIRRDLAGGARHLDVDSASVPGTADPTGGAPISIRLTRGAAVLSELSIRRPLVFRMEPVDAMQVHWPLVLGPSQFYVLGDNVPLSIDSRQFGPISIDQLVGRIEPAC